MSTPAQRAVRQSSGCPAPGGRACFYADLPLTDYRRALELQRRLVAARNTGVLDRDVVLMLEHPAVFTLGRRGGRRNLTVSPALLAARRIAVVHVERGGDITYHGPGQLVGYPILSLRSPRLAVTDYVSALEEVMIRTAADFGVHARRDARNRGIWVGNAKLGSIGIAIRRGISFHGFAFNVNLALEPFSWINPCGLQGIGVTSLAKERRRPVTMADARRAAKKHVTEILGLLPAATDLETLEALSARHSAAGSFSMAPDCPRTTDHAPRA